MDSPDRRSLFSAARKMLIDDPMKKKVLGHLEPDDAPPRLTPHFLQTTRMARSRERILNNLDEMYREAFSRAQSSGDQTQMATLDFAYRREQLYFEILLDIRDAMERR
jgi:hypothetical protein